MRIKPIAAAIAVVILIGLGYFWWYSITFHTVAFDVKVQPMEAKVLDKSGKEVAVVRQTSRITLANGSYSLRPYSTGYDTAPIDFDVAGKNTTVTINPQFDENFLTDLLEEEFDEIKASIVAKYPKISAQFIIDKGKLLGKGEWYVSTLKYKSDSNNDPKDIYKIIMNKPAEDWEIVNVPQITPTIYTFPKVPLNIIQEAYNL